MAITAIGSSNAIVAKPTELELVLCSLNDLIDRLDRYQTETKNALRRAVSYPEEGSESVGKSDPQVSNDDFIYKINQSLKRLDRLANDSADIRDHANKLA